MSVKNKNISRLSTTSEYHLTSSGETSLKKTIIIGLGNPYLCDDSAGLKVVMLLEENVHDPHIKIIESTSSGLEFLNLIDGCDRVIIVDAAVEGGGMPGEIYRLGVEQLGKMLHTTSSHDLDFVAALELGKRLELDLPGEIIIFGIEVNDVQTLTETCTPEVAAAIPVCTEMVLKELGRQDA